MRNSGRLYHEVRLEAVGGDPQVGWLTHEFASGEYV